MLFTLGERLVRNEEATGSIPVSSTNPLNSLRRCGALKKQHFIGPAADQAFLPARPRPDANDKAGPGVPAKLNRVADKFEPCRFECISFVIRQLVVACHLIAWNEQWGR
jgi:hypothetical protein